MGKESTQKKLSRVRPPRVQITYDVEIGDAIETKELPFVLGVLGDYSGHSKQPLPKMKERKFVQIDRDNFDDVLKGMAPRLAMRVDNKLADDGTLMSVELEFNELADFEPQQVVEQVDPLKKLLHARQRLSDLRNKMVGNDKLEELLDDVVRDTEKLREISQGQSNGQGE
ncbi:type VI secretion system contractile sheath small subunit [Andreprevotia chitinilytica]|uniref:type VI secretion system contractile sheath small subunit n=1 Tax=Andreprevotia chitinilytica TaxID=396808 RepID=UPI000556F6CA|nr:type VI secretion system contractile sheath small subunit [Andreprevotia chitinilytica]